MHKLRCGRVLEMREKAGWSYLLGDQPVRIPPGPRRCSKSTSALARGTVRYGSHSRTLGSIAPEGSCLGDSTASHRDPSLQGAERRGTNDKIDRGARRRARPSSARAAGSRSGGNHDPEQS
eukprot:scaffold1424_cov237-Pinguiococcus_pyrenoidosus.AAC.3